MFKQFYRGFSLSGLIILSACGGGGGGSTTTPVCSGSGSGCETPSSFVPVGFNWYDAWNKFVRQSTVLNYTITGSENGVAISGTGKLIIKHESTLVNFVHNLTRFSGTKSLDNLKRTQIEFLSDYTSINGKWSISEKEDWYLDANDLMALRNPDNFYQYVTTTRGISNSDLRVTDNIFRGFVGGVTYGQSGFECGYRAWSFSVANNADSLAIRIRDSYDATSFTSDICPNQVSGQKVFNFIANNNGFFLKSIDILDKKKPGALTFVF